MTPVPPEAAPPRATTPEPSEPDWVVWSIEHHGWWGPNHSGYFASLLLAGLYTEAEAKEIERGANRSRQWESERALRLTDALAKEAQCGRRGGKVVDLLTLGIRVSAPLAAPAPESGTPTLNEIVRYHLSPVGVMQSYTGGAWVRYEDVKAERAALTERATRAETEVAKWREIGGPVRMLTVLNQIAREAAALPSDAPGEETAEQ